MGLSIHIVRLNISKPLTLEVSFYEKKHSQNFDENIYMQLPEI